jgi:Peptidase family M23
MQARFYAPWWGRFLSPDPKYDEHFQDTQGWNIYSYVMNQPTMKVDPTGMVVDDPTQGITEQFPQLTELRVAGGNVCSLGVGPEYHPTGIFAWQEGTVQSAGWQVPGVEHGSAALAGYVIRIEKDDGGTFGFGHAKPGSSLPVGRTVHEGDEIGTYADPTNGHSSGPHAHLFETNKDGNMIAPKINGKRVAHNQKITTRFGVVDKLHPKPHRGTDVIDPQAKEKPKLPKKKATQKAEVEPAKVNKIEEKK